MFRFSIGMLSAFCFSVIFLAFSWDWIFYFSSSGSNVLISLLASVLIIHTITIKLGTALDIFIFNGGSRKRAVLFFQAFELLKLLKERKNKSKKGDFSYVRISNQIISLEATVKNIRKSWWKRGEREKDKHAYALGIIIEKNKDLFLNSSEKNFNLISFLKNFRSLFLVFFLVLFVRIFLIETFQIPSSSMVPTLLVGDHLFVSKIHYGIKSPLLNKHVFLKKAPARGDVVVFKAPAFVGKLAGYSWIKRVVATSGQKIKIVNNIIYVNEIPNIQTTLNENFLYVDQNSKKKYSKWTKREAYVFNEFNEHKNYTVLFNKTNNRRELSEWPTGDGFKNLSGLICDNDCCIIKKGYVFVMGDNRHNSNDSRFWGCVPVENIEGKALFTWISVDASKTLFQFGKIKLPVFRWNRSLKAII